MTVIPIRFVRKVASYNSPEAAIEAACRDRRQPLARAAGEQLAGTRLVGVRTCSWRWSFEFTGPVWLDITVARGEVAWQMKTDPTVFDREDEPFGLRWPTSGEVTVLDPKRLFAGKVGADFWQLFAYDGKLNVYFHKRRFLWFAALRRVDDGSPILYVAEEEGLRP